MRSLCPTTKSRPHLLQLEKARARQWRSSAAKSKINLKKKKPSICTCSTFLFSWTTSSSQSVMWAQCHKVTPWSTPALFLYQPGDSPENISRVPESINESCWFDEEEDYITLAQDNFAQILLLWHLFPKFFPEGRLLILPKSQTRQSIWEHIFLQNSPVFPEG